MTMNSLAASIAIEEMTRFAKGDLADLCDAAEAAISNPLEKRSAIDPLTSA